MFSQRKQRKNMVFFIIFLIIAILLVSCIKIVPQAHAFVIERLGTYMGTWTTGLHFKVPIIDKVAKDISLKERPFKEPLFFK